MPFPPNKWPDKDPGQTTAQPVTVHAKDMYVWKTYGENCPACQKMANRCYPWAYWAATIQPGFHENCDCRLVKAGPNVYESPHDLWGTEPLWWDPTQDVWEFLTQLFDRYLKYFQRQGQGDKYSGFDNLFPVFISESGFTTAAGTLGMGGPSTLFPILKWDTDTQLFLQIFKDYLGLGKDKFNSRYKIRVQGYSGYGSFDSCIWRKLRDPEVTLPSEGVNKKPIYVPLSFLK